MKSRKMFLKPLAILMTVCFLVQTVVAEENRRNDTQKEIVVSGDVEKEKVQLIIDTINGEEIISTRSNVLCLFGHSLAQTRAYETTHRYYAAAPRCLQVTYDVTYCTRSGCNYAVYTEIGRIRIYCCS